MVKLYGAIRFKEMLVIISFASDPEKFENILTGPSTVSTIDTLMPL